MATLNFPDAPDTGDIYFDSNSGFTYEWNGTVWISRDPSTIPTIKELDNISGSFNGSTTTFNLTASSIAVSPATAQQLLINIGNVMQNPGDDYTVSGSTITFTTAPVAGYAFQGTLLGSQIALGTVVDGTISPSSLDTSDSYTVGGITVTGITTANDLKISGISTVTKLVPSDLKVTGIGTVSNVIMTKDAAGLGATMGAAVGVVTYYGDGSSLTGLGLTMFPVSYDPGISSTGQAIDTNITLDWNRPVKAGSGTITIRTGSASGTVVDQFVVGSSSSITFANNQVILNPAADLTNETEYFVTFPAGTVKEAGDQLENSQVNYSFTTVDLKYELWTTGYNVYGALGQNDVVNKSSPVQIPGTTWENLGQFQGTGYGGGMAIKSDGTLWTWGSQGTYGALGLNSRDPGTRYSSPTQVPGTWSTASIQADNGMGVKSDGTLWTWGRNNVCGELADGTTIDRSSPVQVGTDTTWSKTFGQQAIAGGPFAAMKTDGSLWSWGAGNHGSPGQNNRTQYNSPVRVGTDTTWSKLTGGYDMMASIKTDGTLWVWGGNYEGQLGLNQQGPGPSLFEASSPTQVPGTTWSDIANLGRHCVALKTDGTLWSWGYNEQGQLGHNNETDYSSPTQIPGTTWSKIGRQGSITRAIKTDGTLWVWGTNLWGQLGDNSVAQKSSPTQIPGTSWHKVGDDYMVKVV